MIPHITYCNLLEIHEVVAVCISRALFSLYTLGKWKVGDEIMYVLEVEWSGGTCNVVW